MFVYVSFHSHIVLLRIIVVNFDCVNIVHKEFRQVICSSHLTLCLTLNFIFGYCSRECLDLKITVSIFCWYLLVTWPWRHYLLTKPIKFSANLKRILCWSIFATEPIGTYFFHSQNPSYYAQLEREFSSIFWVIELQRMGPVTMM